MINKKRAGGALMNRFFVYFSDRKRKREKLQKFLGDYSVMCVMMHHRYSERGSMLFSSSLPLLFFDNMSLHKCFHKLHCELSIYFFFVKFLHETEEKFHERCLGVIRKLRHDKMREFFPLVTIFSHFSHTKISLGPPPSS